MLALVLFAFVSGVITILSPCILPVLPIVLSGGIGGGKARPFGVIAGFVASFTFFTLALSAIVSALGIPADALRWLAIALVALFGAAMLVPALNAAFERLAAGIASRGAAAGARPAGGRGGSGFWGGLPVGLSLGLVWTPCVGPIMASVISLALSQKVDGGSVFITLAYTLGTSLPMFGVMVGGRALIKKAPVLSRRAGAIQRGFGAVMILVAAAMALQWDRKLQSAVLAAFPSYGSGLTAVEELAPVRGALAARNAAARGGSSGGGSAAQLAASSSPALFSGVPAGSESRPALGDYGAAPPFTAAGPWLYAGPGPAPSFPLSLASLKGKVVLVDFWTYSCVNCVRTIPYLQAWYRAYKDKGLVIVGVHSPEFAFERVSANVSKAMRDLGVSWPVVQDNGYDQWRAYGNNFWPAHYFIDAKGKVRYWHFGEGEYANSEEVIKTLLAEAGAQVAGSASPAEYSLADRTPETYLGYKRAKGFDSAVQPVADKPVLYRPARVPAEGEWSLTGSWTISGEYVSPAAEASKGGQTSLELAFNAKDAFLVIEPGSSGGRIRVSLDGSSPPDTVDVKGGFLAPDSSRLYHLVALPKSGVHRLKLDPEGDPKFFAFTFG